MMIMTTLQYPNNIAEKVAQKYFEVLEKYPEDNSLGDPLVPVGVYADANGINVIAISNVNKGKLEDALEYVGKQNVEYGKIEGVRYETKVLRSAEEALALLGMEA